MTTPAADVRPTMAAVDWQLRPATMADVDVTAQLVREVERHDIGEALITATEFAAEWRRPGMDLTGDVRIVDIDGRAVAYAQQYHGRGEVAVHPDVRGRGIGTALAEWTEDHARGAGLRRVGQTLPVTATGAVRLLTDRGYRPLWESWLLRRDLSAMQAEPTPPAGVHIRSLRRPDDDRPLYEVVDRAFSEWPDRDPPMGFDDWRTMMLDHDDSDPELTFVADADGRVVGAAVCAVDGDEGWVEQLAVARQWRGHGLGRALLQTAFHRFAGRGLSTACLATDSRTGARSLYERAGMQVVHTFRRYSLPLD